MKPSKDSIFTFLLTTGVIIILCVGIWDLFPPRVYFFPYQPGILCFLGLACIVLAIYTITKRSNEDCYIVKMTIPIFLREEDRTFFKEIDAKLRKIESGGVEEIEVLRLYHREGRIVDLYTRLRARIDALHRLNVKGEKLEEYEPLTLARAISDSVWNGAVYQSISSQAKKLELVMGIDDNINYTPH